MAYCVNCGVELDPELERCPLCNTPVYRPSDYEEPDKQTFPEKRGEVEKVSRRDSVIFISVLALTIIVTCSLLNVLVYDAVKWAVPVAGIVLTIWVLCLSILFVDVLTGYGLAFVNAIAIAGGLYLIARVTVNDAWLYRIGLPIVGVILLLSELFLLLSHKLRFSILVGTFYFFVGVAATCVSIEAILDYFFYEKISLSWSAIVLTVCSIIAVILGMILVMSGVRNMVRRRLHF